MCNCVPPLVNHANRYQQFVIDANTQGHLRQKATAVFGGQPYASFATWSMKEQVEEFGPLQFLAVPAPEQEFRAVVSKNEYSSSYLLSQVLAKHIAVNLNGAQLEATVSSLSTPPTQYSKFVRDKPNPGTLPLPSRPNNNNHDEEFFAQDSEPEMFLLWVCRSHLNSKDRLDAIGELLDIASMALANTVLRAKQLCKIARPLPSAQTLVPVPQHSSWPGGHAFLAGAYATLIHKALPSGVATAVKADLEAAARRIANNREGMGLHWAEDAEAGLLLGNSVMLGLLHLAANDAYSTEIRPAHFGELVARAKQIQ